MIGRSKERMGGGIGHKGVGGRGNSLSNAVCKPSA